MAKENKTFFEVEKTQGKTYNVSEVSCDDQASASITSLTKSSRTQLGEIIKSEIHVIKKKEQNQKILD